MLRVIQRMDQLSFFELMQVYRESNEENARAFYPGREDGVQQAQMDFYEYLRTVFFKTPGAVYYLWEDSGHIVTALRLEPYNDGLLLTGLETDPQWRGRGYACMLMKAVLAQVQGSTVYSHIDRQNRASIAVHRRCGFEKVNNFAVFLDGSVSRNADTYVRKFVNN